MNERTRLRRLAKLRALRADWSQRRLDAALREEAHGETTANAASDRRQAAEERAESYVPGRFAEADSSHNPAQFIAELTHNVRFLRSEARTLRIDAAMQRRLHVAATQRRAAAAADFSEAEARRAQIERAERLLNRRQRNLREDAEEQSQQENYGARRRNGIG